MAPKSRTNGAVKAATAKAAAGAKAAAVAVTAVVAPEAVAPTSDDPVSISSPAALAPARKPDLHLVVSETLERPSCRDRSDMASAADQSNDDAVYEQDIVRDPGSIKPWLAYIQFKMQHGTLHEQAFVLERACLQLPRSYKLWKMVSPANRPPCFVKHGP